jgi:hypothetical protein
MGSLIERQRVAFPGWGRMWPLSAPMLRKTPVSHRRCGLIFALIFDAGPSSLRRRPSSHPARECHVTPADGGRA